MKRFMPVNRASDTAYAIANAIRSRKAEKAQRGWERVKMHRRVKKHNSQPNPPYYLTSEGEYPWD